MWRILFKAALSIFFCLMFLWHVKDSVQKYVSKDTIVSTTDIRDPNLTFPDIIVCVKEGFKTDKMKELGLEPNFWSLATDYSIFERIDNIKVDRPANKTSKELDELFVASTYSQEEVIQNATFRHNNQFHEVDTLEIPSSLFGRCYTIRTTQVVNRTHQMKVIHMTDPGEKGIVIFIQPPNFESFFITADFVLTPYYQISLYKGESLEMAVSKTTETIVHKDCSKRYTDCFMHHSLPLVNCSMPQIKPWGAGKPSCAGDGVEPNLPLIMGRVLLRNCPTACLHDEYIVKKKIAKRSNYDKIDALMFYRQLEVKEIRKTKLFDFNTIISSVGGSLGLFLGFSCLGAAFSLLEWLFEKKIV